jgi:hypothetical protein
MMFWLFENTIMIHGFFVYHKLYCYSRKLKENSCWRKIWKLMWNNVFWCRKKSFSGFIANFFQSREISFMENWNWKLELVVFSLIISVCNKSIGRCGKIQYFYQDIFLWIRENSVKLLKEKLAIFDEYFREFPRTSQLIWIEIHPNNRNS